MDQAKPYRKKVPTARRQGLWPSLSASEALASGGRRLGSTTAHNHLVKPLAKKYTPTKVCQVQRPTGPALLPKSEPLHQALFNTGAYLIKIDIVALGRVQALSLKLLPRHQNFVPLPIRGTKLSPPLAFKQNHTTDLCKRSKHRPYFF